VIYISAYKKCGMTTNTRQSVKCFPLNTVYSRLDNSNVLKMIPAVKVAWKPQDFNGI
jgi:hypothetical protein